MTALAAALPVAARRVLEAFERGLRIFCGLLLALLLFVVLSAVAMRYGLGAGLFGADEAVEYGLVDRIVQASELRRPPSGFAAAGVD